MRYWEYRMRKAAAAASATQGTVKPVLTSTETPGAEAAKVDDAKGEDRLAQTAGRAAKAKRQQKQQAPFKISLSRGSK